MTTTPPAAAPQGCEADTIPGVLTAINDNFGIQSCDQCRIYPGDLEAALALSARIPGAVVRYHEFHADYSHAGPIKTYDGSDDTVMVDHDTDPWIETPDGTRIDWTTYRLTDPHAVVQLDRTSANTTIVRKFKVTMVMPDVNYEGREFQPDSLHISYRHDHDGDGWTCDINLAGPRRLRNGTLGDSTVRTWWSGQDQAPQWARDIANAHRPGELRLGDQPV